MEHNQVYLDAELPRLQEEEERFVEEMLRIEMEREPEAFDEEYRELVAKHFRLKFTADLFLVGVREQYLHHHHNQGPEHEFKHRLLTLKHFKVVKFLRVFQSLFYLLKYKREDLCWPHTNKLWWLEAKNFLDEEFISRLAHYRCLGPKDDDYTKY